MSPPNSKISKKPKQNAKWDLVTTNILLQVCMNEIPKYRKSKISFKIKRWEVVVKEFNTRTNKNYTQKQLKNRLDSLRNEWTLFKQLKGKETDLGWNHETGTIEADATWWEVKIKTNPKYARFWYHGLEYADELEYIFGDAVAINRNVLTQTMGVPIEDTAKSADLTPLQNNVESNAEEINCDEDDSPIINTQIKRKIMMPEKMKKKVAKGRAKIKTVTSLQRTLELLCEVA
ncbi:Myb/SANT-like domain - like 7 [Theobroma cacao]|nr:Myb/SANT-like domain - like 7 [Theobroma cacao]